MVACCWSAKGGQGTSVVACALASRLARADALGAVLVDLAGDAPAVAGLPDDRDAVGVADWLREPEGVPSDALARLEEPVGHGLALLRRGSGALEAGRAGVLSAVLHADPRPVVIDAGLVADGESVPAHLAAAADQSLLVTRPCYLAMRRALAAPVRPSGIVVVLEPGRALTTNDIEAALGVPVVAEVELTVQVARWVDAGVFASRVPRSLFRGLRAVRHAV
jgi:hypothetical protein